MNTDYMNYRQNLFKSKIALIKEKIRHIFHNTHDSRETARSVAIGIFIGLSPTFGLHIIIVVLLWNILRYTDRWRFNLPIAISLTFITNYFTIVPYYFLCYHTGAWIYNNVNTSLDYQAFSTQWHSAIERGFFHSLHYLIKRIPGMFKSIMIGASLYAVLFSVLSYKLVLYRINRIRSRNGPQ